MKTRIIKTKIWESSSTLKLPSESRYLTIYLLTSPHIGLCGMFEIPDAFIMLETGLDAEQLASAKKALEESKKIFFYEDWVFVKNHTKHNPYNLSPKTKVAYDKEVSLVPTSIMSHFLKLSDTSMDSSMDSSLTIVPLIPNKEIRNHKPETIIGDHSKKLDYSKIKNMDSDEVPF